MFPTRRALLRLILVAGASSLVPLAQAGSCEKALQNLLSDAPRLLKFGHGIFPTQNEVKVLEQELLTVNGKLLNELTQKPELRLGYVIAPDDRIYLVRGDLKLNPDHPWMANVMRDDGTPWSFPIKEAGQLLFKRDKSDLPLGEFSFEARYGVELSQEETKNYMRQMQEIIDKDPRLADRLKLKRPRTLAKTLKCTDAFADGRSAKQFIMSRVFVSATMLTGGILINHPERFDVLLAHTGLKPFDPKRDYDGNMLAADYTSTAFNSLFQAYVGYHISAKGLSFLENRIGSKLGRALLARGATSMGSIALQTLLYAVMTDHNVKGLGAYNVGFSLVSIVKNHYLDEFLYEKLPQVVYDACLVNPALNIIIGQKTVRFVEGFASTTLYLKGRELFTGE